jgi:hypothetical protein
VLQSRITPHTAVQQLRLRTPGRDDTLWSKRYLKRAGDARKEFEFLRAADERLRAFPAFAVVEPVVLIEEWSALVTRHAHGQDLWANVRRAAPDEFGRAGEWLGHWHRPVAGRGADDSARIADGIEAVVSAVGGGRRIVELFRDLARRAADDEEPAVRVHGDFAPYNVIAGEGRIIVLDPSFRDDLDTLANVASPCEDLGRFQACLLSTAGRHFDSPGERRLRGAFVGGYNRVAERMIRPDSPRLLLFTARHLLQNLLDWRSFVPRSLRLRRFERWLTPAACDARETRR